MGTRTVAAGGPSHHQPVAVVHPLTVAATRDALAEVARAEHPVPVAGAADVTAPHLVDLLDELLAGPGGDHLAAIAVPWPASGAAWLDDVAVRRGLACLQQRGLALVLVGTGPDDLPAALARLEPGLAVVVGPAG